MKMTLRVFTHPACSGCGEAVEMAWRMAERHDQLKLEIVRLEEEEGLKLAQSIGIKTIPTLIYYRDDDEEIRLVGTPDEAELKSAYLSLIDEQGD